MLKRVVRHTLFLLALVVSVAQAQSHAVLKPLPLLTDHAGTITSKQFLSLLTKKNAGLFLPLSGSARAFNQQTREIVQNGINVGFTRVVEAQINNGSLTGNLFFQESGSTYAQIVGQTPGTFVFGSNPFNVRGGPVAPTVFPPTNNFLTLQPLAFSQSGAGMPIAKGLRVSPPTHLSLAMQAQLKRIEALSQAGVALGARGGQFTGGELSGTFYDGLAGGTYVPTGRMVFAFGNNPLNVTLPPGQTIQITNPANFIDFALGEKSISSGQLYFTVYVPTIREGLLLAVGKDALNNFPASTALTPTNFTSFLFF
jgi:hypothetical protein